MCIRDRGKLASVDAGNDYLVPWAWSYTSVGINKGKVAKALGSTPMPENAWDLVFNPAYTAKLKSCGIAYLDSPTEVIPPAMHYPVSYTHLDVYKRQDLHGQVGREAAERA